ncbi:MAG: CoA transferase [Bacteroidota bacterium]
MFDNLRVLELASVLAGPSVGQFFAELGADVIKVENIKAGGDVTRTWKSATEKTDDRSAYFSSVNWGKRSLRTRSHHSKRS